MATYAAEAVRNPRLHEAPAASPTRHADPDLAALLPEVLSGVSLVRESQRVTVLVRPSDALDAMLGDLGKTPRRLHSCGRLLARRPRWALGPLPIRHRQAAARVRRDRPGLEHDHADHGDEHRGPHRDPRSAAPGQLTQGPLYAFARDDIVLFVQTPDPKLAEEALAAIQ